PGPHARAPARAGGRGGGARRAGVLAGRSRRRRMVPFVIVGALVALAGGASALGVLGGGPSSAGSSPVTALSVATIVVTGNACGPEWSPPRSGQHLLDVENASRHAVYEVELVGANQVSVYGEIEMLAPGTTVPMDVTLPPGRYSFECENDDGASSFSDPGTVTGRPVPGAPSYKPVTVEQILTAIQAYRHSLTPIMATFAHETSALRSAVEEGDYPLARTLWLAADLAWQRMGAVYDTFGRFDTEIDQSPLGLVGTVNSPRFTGLLRLEYGLWHGQSAAVLTPVAEELDADAHALVRAFPGLLMPDITLALRTHEILENTLQFQLTGELDEGSGDGLALGWADVQGTQLSIASLRTLLQANDPALLTALTTGLERMAGAFKAYERPDGGWTPLSALTTIQRERLDGELGALLQQLDDVPDVLDLPILPATAETG
ncbi:MAG TPA: EfeM/EfeO family lipoprotein, partial [Acidimicrobiales bacterium]|nr:EfeM/EfeO family lipoprotein [Acidimicrobiales bacterium]